MMPGKCRQLESHHCSAALAFTCTLVKPLMAMKDNPNGSPGKFAVGAWLRAAAGSNRCWAFPPRIVVAAVVGCLVGLSMSSLSGSKSLFSTLSSSTSLQNVANRYSVLNSTTWAKLPWSKVCGNGPGGHHLCNLPSTWRDCSQGIYLDIGTNVGVQLRKLYNPEQFPDADVLPIFQGMFGGSRSAVCAIGVEANPDHTEYLEFLNGYFRAKGYQVVVLTATAASTHGGKATFYQDKDSPVSWGASLTKGGWQKNPAGGKSEVSVPLLDLPAFFMDVVRPMVVQDTLERGYRPKVAMKLDVEGQEYALLPSFIISGVLCDMDVVMMESHPEYMRSPDGVKMNITDMQALFEKMRPASSTCRVNLTNMDDETYMNGKEIPLPL